MSLLEQFQTEIETYLERTGLDPTTFGKRALNDPRFVFDIRRGRSPGLATIDRVRSFMTESPTEPAAAE